MARTARIAVIGGGIGGLTAAQGLRRNGFEVAVYEAQPELKEIGAGVALGPNAMKALRAIGLEDPVRAIAWEAETHTLRSWKTAHAITETPDATQAERYGAASCFAHRADRNGAGTQRAQARARRARTPPG